MRGVKNQVSNTKSSTACTADLKKKPDTRGTPPSLMRIRVILFHTVFTQDKFLTTAGQSLSATEITRPRYLKEVTIFRGRPYALKALAVTSLSSSAAKRRRFRSTPRLHFAVLRCVPFRALHGTSMSHRGNRG